MMGSLWRSARSPYTSLYTCKLYFKFTSAALFIVSIRFIRLPADAESTTYLFNSEDTYMRLWLGK